MNSATRQTDQVPSRFWNIFELVRMRVECSPTTIGKAQLQCFLVLIGQKILQRRIN